MLRLYIFLYFGGAWLLAMPPINIGVVIPSEARPERSEGSASRGTLGFQCPGVRAPRSLDSLGMTINNSYFDAAEAAPLRKKFYDLLKTCKQALQRLKLES